MSYLNCLLVSFKGHFRNCYSVVPNVCCDNEMTQILILIDQVCEVSKSLETTSNVILKLPFWHCIPLSQVIKVLDF